MIFKVDSWDLSQHPFTWCKTPVTQRGKLLAEGHWLNEAENHWFLKPQIGPKQVYRMANSLPYCPVKWSCPVLAVIPGLPSCTTLHPHVHGGAPDSAIALALTVRWLCKVSGLYLRNLSVWWTRRESIIFLESWLESLHGERAMVWEQRASLFLSF